MTRILTALVLIPLVVWVVLSGPSLALLAVMTLVGLIAFHESTILPRPRVSPAPDWQAWPLDSSCSSRPSRCG